MAGEVALAIVGVAEVFKLLIEAQNAAIKVGMTPEEFKKVSDAVNAGFESRDPAKLPEV